MLCVVVRIECVLTLAWCAWQVCKVWWGGATDTARMCLSSAHEFALPALSFNLLDGSPHCKREK